ncbi:MAG: hypothetical protein QM396_04325 [Euryarchaeota archaeon]|jgi:hypothetical protein|uniref:hypothetical protein n=1 Tax=Methanobacterium sp. MZD130B TaxID=3394378 RepID=UPI001766588A|nr:hypothetical protein [Euryarchaeota archaeon]HHT19580.1 hypothetical protein [Methanobacterium sp.]
MSDYRLNFSEYDLDVKAKIKELGYDTGNSIVFLPYKFEQSQTTDDMIYTMPEIIMGKSFNMMDFKTEFLTGRKELELLDEIGTLIITIMIPTQMFLVFPILMNILSRQLPQYYDEEKIGFNFILEKPDGKYLKIDYFGLLADFAESKKEVIETSKDVMGLSYSDIIAILEDALKTGSINQMHFKMMKNAFSP